jgi:general stress protein YciG
MIYVGKHITNNLNDGYMGSGLKIRDAIKKYGLENFEKTILFECKSEDEMNAKEAEIVNEDFIARDDVYNIKLGGDGGWDEANKKSTNAGSNHFFKNKTTEEISEIGRKGGLASAKRIQNMSPIERQQYHDLRSKIAKMGFS